MESLDYSADAELRPGRRQSPRTPRGAHQTPPEPVPARPRRLRALVLAAALAAGAALSAAFYVSWPFTGDQGIFAWVASRIVDGGLPYRDAWDTKGPAAYYLTVPAVVLFGHEQWGFRLYDLFWLAAGAAGVAGLARGVARRAGAAESRVRAAGVMAAALLVLWYLSLDPYNTAQPDGWAAMTLALGAAALVRGAPRSAPSLGAAAAFGACVGVATLVKPTYGIYGFVALVYLASLVRDGGRPWRALAAPYTALLAGFVGVLGACAAWFAAHGALGDLRDVYLRFGPEVYARTNSDALLVRLRYMEGFVVGRFGVALPFVLGAAVWLRRRARAEGVMLLTWLLCVFANVLTQGRDLNFPYRWLSLYPAFAALTALGVLGVREMLREHARALGVVGGDGARVTSALAAAVLVSAAFTPVYYAFRWAKYATGRSDAAHYYATELGPEYGWYGGPQSMGGIVDYVRAHTSPRDAVLVWDSQPGVNFLSRRRSPVRFAWSGALTYGDSTPERAAYRREYLASVAADPPLYVVAMDDATCAHHSAQSLWCLKSFPEFQAYVAEHYRKETNIYAHDVWRRVKG